ncbi:hypothetical protein EON63_13025 [archaeon]|nr:MAG: hypothetical protein EON63_13025 [archaeon]
MNPEPEEQGSPASPIGTPERPNANARNGQRVIYTEDMENVCGHRTGKAVLKKEILISLGPMIRES